LFWLPNFLKPDGHIATMNNAEFQLQEPGDPRLTAYAASPLPAWLWSANGVRILWANPAGVRVFGAANAAALASRIFGPADRHRRQVARLASRLLANGAIRLNDGAIVINSEHPQIIDPEIGSSGINHCH